MKGEFYTVSDEELKGEKATDIYFLRAQEILEKDGLSDTEVNAEITMSSLPNGYNWGVFAGLRDALKLIESKDLPVDVYAMPEGTITPRIDEEGKRIPQMVVRGKYGPFAPTETPLLGFLSSGSGVATKAARIRKVAGEKSLAFFGARRSHPALIKNNGLYAYIGGFDDVSSPLAAEAIGKNPLGTMPHSFLIIYKGKTGDHVNGWEAFDEYMPKNVPRVALVDTFLDEVEESKKAVETIGEDKISGVRLDTPSSRRGDFPYLVKEVKWKLESAGYEDVKIFCSGGIDEYSLEELIEAGADGFGIGGAVADAPIIDYAMDITAIKERKEWKPIAKRDRFDGLKQVWRYKEGGEFRYKVLRKGKELENGEPMLKKYIENGEVIKEPPEPEETRDYVLEQLNDVELDLTKKKNKK